MNKKIEGALAIAHKQWVIDQIIRYLTGDGYNKWVKEWEDSKDGPQTYVWDTGIAP